MNTKNISPDLHQVQDGKTEHERSVEEHTDKQLSEESRERLKELSRNVRPLVEQGIYPTINEAIMAVHYRNQEHTDFKSYRQWHAEGFQVQKGEKSFLLWGKPKEGHGKKEEEKESPGKDELADDAYTFFPVAHVFSNAQVMEIDRTGLQELEDTRNSDRNETDIER